ncbi:MAG TPA: hypothetical protein VM261_24930 [Kofleriaceae bacterium]|nr:hypothetical protein [Kofleriaceae bacterium]
MGLLKRAPKVVIFSPRTLLVGRPYDVEVVITTPEPLDVDFVEARVEGEQGWAVGSGKSRTSRREVFPELALRMMEASTLPAGETRLRARFTLPPGTPPSHEVRPAWAYLDLHVRVGIPWWPDGHYRFTLPVRIPPPAHIERVPRAFRSSSDSPDDKRLELSLPSTTFIAGETITGSCAIFHVDDRKERELEIALVPHLSLVGWRTREREGSALGVTIRIPAGAAGTNIPFQFKLPPTIVPTFETLTHQLSWQLVASTGSFFSGKLELAVPLTVVDASAADVVQALALPPRLADERVGQLFDQLAVRGGWQRARTTRDGDVVVEQEVDTSTARLTYTYRGEDGTFLISTVERPSLGLGLVVTPSSSIRHVFFEDVEVDIADWDRRHLVAARAPAQAIPFLKQVVPVVKSAGELGSMVRWTDDAITFERQVGTLDEHQLAEIAATLAHVAAAINRAAFDIAPPPDVTLDVAAWRDLAHRLDGASGMGDLSIDGTLDRARVSLGLERRDGKPHGVRVSVGDPDAAGADLRAISLDLAHPRADILSTKNVEPIVEQVVGWPADVVELRLHDGVASALWLLPGGATPAMDAERVRQLVTELRTVLAALAPGAGPYR